MSSNEEVFCFGPEQGLVGILTQPEASAAAAESPVFLMWNVGLNHRVGPFRVFVSLARRLAQQGFASLRFDVSGLGDSEASRSDSRSDEERIEGDVRLALDALTAQRGHKRFVLIGFCSSVDQTHALALSDDRVVGAVFLEGYTYLPKHSRRSQARKLAELPRWERLVRTRFPALFGEPPGWHESVSEQEQVYKRVYPRAEQFGRDVRKIAERGVQMLFVYVKGDSAYRYREQLYEHTGRGAFESNLQLEFFADADHTFYVTEHRDRMMERLCAWAGVKFAKDSPLDSSTGAAAQRG